MANNLQLGAAKPQDGASDFNLISFVAEQLDNKAARTRLVSVVAVYPGSGLAPDTVDVHPLVNQIDGAGNATPHGVVHGIPVFMMFGAGSAVKITPAVGDLGVMICEDRDISSVKATGAQANPGSRRTFDFADGLYFGGFLNSAASQYVLLNSAGVSIKSPTAITMTVGSKAISITSSGITLDGILWDTHVHGGVQSGGASTTGPAA